MGIDADHHHHHHAGRTPPPPPLPGLSLTPTSRRAHRLTLTRDHQSFIRPNCCRGGAEGGGGGIRQRKFPWKRSDSWLQRGLKLPSDKLLGVIKPPNNPYWGCQTPNFCFNRAVIVLPFAPFSWRYRSRVAKQSILLLLLHEIFM